VSLVVEPLAGTDVVRVSRWIFNCYVLPGDDGPVVVDAGLPGAPEDLAPVLSGMRRALQAVVRHPRAQRPRRRCRATGPQHGDAPVHLPETTLSYLSGATPRSPTGRAVASIWPTLADQRPVGRFSEPLAAVFVDHASLQAGESALDVGCGPGSLTAELVTRLGAGAVTAVDPSQPFVEAARRQLPGVDVRLGAVEALPFADGAFDVVLAQLVVHFMSDPLKGLAEMARVGRRVGACVWDHTSGTGPLSLFSKLHPRAVQRGRPPPALVAQRQRHLLDADASPVQAALREHVNLLADPVPVAEGEVDHVAFRVPAPVGDFVQNRDRGVLDSLSEVGDAGEKHGVVVPRPVGALPEGRCEVPVDRCCC